MDDSERARRAAEVRVKKAVLELPGMNGVKVLEGRPYEAGTFDLYVATAPAPAPTVVFIYGFPGVRFGEGLRQMGAYTSWGRLLAASGMNAVAYSYRDPVADLSALFAHLRREEKELGIDTRRMALWAASGNVPTALYWLMQNKPGTFCAAALLYGYMLDVPAAAEQFGLAVPARGRSIGDLPPDPALLVVRAGNDTTPGLNASLDAFVSEALAHDLPLSLLNVPGAQHSFDLFEDSDASRDAIRRVLAFLREHLKA
ncbi:MAG TPA: alpha/beta hydrolase [Polyangia bacterium]|nr:alpha/beta hydrolase [Polyangia bacterium]